MATASFVLAVPMFRDNALETVLPRGLEHLVAIRDEVAGIADVIGGFQYLIQQLFSALQRDGSQIVAVQVQQVEQKDRGRSRTGQVRDAVWIGNGDARLD